MNRGFSQGLCHTDINETDLITVSDFVFALQKVNFTIKKIYKPYKPHIKENSYNIQIGVGSEFYSSG